MKLSTGLVLLTGIVLVGNGCVTAPPAAAPDAQKKGELNIMTSDKEIPADNPYKATMLQKRTISRDGQLIVSAIAYLPAKGEAPAAAEEQVYVNCKPVFYTKYEGATSVARWLPGECQAVVLNRNNEGRPDVVAVLDGKGQVVQVVRRRGDGLLYPSSTDEVKLDSALKAPSDDLTPKPPIKKKK